jgi:hypothetical protein
MVERVKNIEFRFENAFDLVDAEKYDLIHDKGTFDVVRDLWAEGGAKSFYRGCGTNLVRFAVQTFILGDSSAASRLAVFFFAWWFANARA